MNLAGEYKINIEMSARKQVEGHLVLAKRLTALLGSEAVPETAETEKHVRDVVAMLEENRSIVDSITVRILHDRIVISSCDGEMEYVIKNQEVSGIGQVELYLDSEETGGVVWSVACVEPFFVFESDDELSAYVLERQCGPAPEGFEAALPSSPAWTMTASAEPSRCATSPGAGFSPLPPR